ncbi:MAG: hypothetical protein SOZ07_08530 [Prevotella sp.]|nr:hypothetical protein [Prevotella sp.]
MEQDRIFIRHKTVKPAQEAAHCRGKQTRPTGLFRGTQERPYVEAMLPH